MTRAEPSTQEKNDRFINRAWGVAVLSGVLTTAVGLFALAGKPLLPGINGGSVVDGVMLCALGFGVYKRNRVAAVLLPTLVLVGTIYALSQGTKTSPLQIVFAYFYFRGMLAVLAYRKQLSAAKVSELGENRPAESRRRVVRPVANAGQRPADGEPELSLKKPAGQSGNREIRELAAFDATAKETLPQRTDKKTRWEIPRRMVLVPSAIIVLIGISTTAWHFAANSSHKRTLKSTRESVALLRVFDSTNKLSATGSGFFVSSDGILITNFHVIKGASRVVAKLESGAMYDVTGVLAGNEKSDIALLRVEATDAPFLELGDSVKAEIGQHVMVIGSPLGLEGTVSDGIISAKREMPDTGKLLQITAPIAHGSSGSPVLDANNDVIGVATLLISEGQALNFAVPVETAKGLLNSVQPDTEIKSFAALAKETEKKLENDPEYKRLKVALQFNECKKALSLVKSLDTRFPENVELYMSAGLALVGLEQYDKAVKTFEHAVELQSDDAYLWAMLGDTYQGAGDLKQAISAYEKALEIQPDYAESRLSLAQAYNSIGMAYDEQANVNKALAAYEKAVSLNPSADYAWYNIGRLYTGQHNAGEAIGPLERAVQINHDRADAWIFLAINREHLKHYGEAAQAFEHYTSLKPADVDGWQGLGRCYLRLSRPRDAVVTIRRAISLKSEDPKLWELLTVAYRDSGQTAEGISAFQRYQSLSSR